ncbi:serine hydrolase domain-containing protein [Undibacterium sp. Ji49W]|uniref:serine hydrolase domain-containing protein n=1 Tax=Undibacterium sp. Ji49W TaxID=3413040 RepID=UPI003BEF8568
MRAIMQIGQPGRRQKVCQRLLLICASAAAITAQAMPFWMGAAMAQTSSASSVPQSSLDSQVTKKLASIVADPQLPLAGLSVLSIKNGKIIYQQQFGQRYIARDHPANNLAVDAQTLFRVASVSKMVAAIGAMCLVEQGRLDLDADISRYLGYQVRNPHFPDVAITTRMLLSHTSSLRDEGGYNFPANVSLHSFLLPAGAHFDRGLQWARPSGEQAGESRAPGKYFHYVNLNWGVLGTVMEAASGQRFDMFMRDTVLRPLGVTGAYHPELLSPDELSRLAVLYRKQENEIWNLQGPWVAQTDDFRATPLVKRSLDNYVPGSNATLFSPQGGLRIDVQGLARIMLMLMNEGELDGRRFLQSASVRALLSEQWRYDKSARNGDDYHGLFQAWGLGFQRFSDVSAQHYGDRLVSPVKGKPAFKAVGHLGFAYGLQSGFMFDPATRNGMIYIISGVAADPEKNPGNYSSLSLWEEQILTTLYRFY